MQSIAVAVRLCCAWEMAHQELGMKVLERVRGDLGELGKVEQMPRLEGRQMAMVIAPR